MHVFVTVTHIYDAIHTLKMFKALYRYRSKQMMRKVTVGKTVLLASWKSSLRKLRLPDSVQNSIYTVWLKFTFFQ